MLALGAPAAAARAAEPGPAAQSEARLDEGWAVRLSAAAKRRDAAAERLRSDVLAVRIARHRNHPRGAALEALKRDVETAREQLAFAEQALPELLEQARRAGASPDVLLPYESE